MSDDAIEAGILENIRLGYVEFAGVGEDGKMRYRLTAEGEKRVTQLLEDNNG